MEMLAHKALEAHLVAVADRLHTQAQAAAEELEGLENMLVA
jgi:hypothetical protein